MSYFRHNFDQAALYRANLNPYAQATTRSLKTTVGDVSCDYLILAAGSTTHFYGVAGAADHAFTLKSLDVAVRLRNHILCNFERAARDSGAEQRRARLTFSIVNLLGFRNRLFVLINWAWDHFLFERMVRLILSAASRREPCLIAIAATLRSRLAQKVGKPLQDISAYTCR